MGLKVPSFQSGLRLSDDLPSPRSHLIRTKDSPVIRENPGDLRAREGLLSPHSGDRKGRSSVSGTRGKDLISIYVTGDGELLSHFIAGKTEA